MDKLEPVWIWGTDDERVAFWTRETLERIYAEQRDEDDLKYVGSCIFMASDKPVLFLAGQRPGQSTGDMACVIAFSIETIPDDKPELREAFERHRSQHYSSDDLDEIGQLVSAPRA